MFKRIISLLLILVLMVGMIPAQAFGTEAETTVDTGMTIEGTNALGDLLTEEISAWQDASLSAQEEYEPGFSVTELTFSGSRATVTYDAMEEATLVVAVYTEDGLTLLNSAYKTVSPDQTTATVTISGEMPQYFYAAAYLLDTYDLSPLCQDYSTPIYTQAMQELLDSTVSDYPAERVLNLDDRNSTNFIVYDEKTVIVEEKSGVNTVVSADDDTMTYVIENADEQFTSLRSGDVVAYAYGSDQYLFAKVGSVEVSGSRVTIYGAKLDVDEVFSHIKIEADSSDAEITYDSSSLSEGLTRSSGSGSSDISIGNGGISGTKDIGETFTLFEVGKTKGTLTFAMDLSVKYYSVEKVHFLEFRDDAEIELKANFETEYSATKKLGKFGASFAMKAIYVGLEPSVNFTAQAEAEISATVTATVGGKFESGKGGSSLNETPKVSYDLTMEGSVYLGVDFGPTLKILGGVLVDADMKLGVGVRIDGKLTGSITGGTLVGEEEPEDTRHSCEKCIDLNAYCQLDFQMTVQFIKLEFLTYSSEEESHDIHLGQWYYSVDRNKFDEGQCPYEEYRVSIEVLDYVDDPVGGASVTVSGTDGSQEIGTTNANGIFSVYLPLDQYTIRATSGDLRRTVSTGVLQPRKVTLNLPEPPEPNETLPPETLPEETTPPFPGGILGNVTSKPVVSYGKPDKKGIFKLSDDFYWEYYNVDYTLANYEHAILVVYGNGEMTQEIWNSGVYYSYWEDYEGVLQEEELSMPTWVYKVVLKEGITGFDTIFRPDKQSTNRITPEVVSLPSTIKEIPDEAFYDSHIQKIELTGDITRIGDRAFWRSSIQEFDIPNTVTSIGEETFASCQSLKKIMIPDSVTSIGKNAFLSCTSLEELTIPGSVKEFGDQAFSWCTNLKRLTVEEGITVLGNSGNFNKTGSGLFRYNSSLSSVKLPKSLVRIGDSAFYNCTSLESISIPQNVEEIGYGAFADSGLKQITIPDSVTKLEGGAFAYCYNLESVTLGNGIKELGYNEFRDCTSLKSIVLPENIVHIGTTAFAGCTGLTEVQIECENLFTLYERAFLNCTSLKRIELPFINYVYGNAFWGCTGLEEIVFTGCVQSVDNRVYFNETGLGHQEETYADVFPGINAKVYYPWECSVFNKDSTAYTIFTEEKMAAIGSRLTWIPYTLTEDGTMIPDESKAWRASSKSQTSDFPSEEETVPEETVPEMTVPEETEPQVTVPDETVPQETVPTETLAEETTPVVQAEEEPVPDGTVPEETVSQETEPMTLADLFFQLPGFLTATPTALAEKVMDLFLPEETVPVSTEPEETIPAETVPEESVPAETVNEEDETEHMEANSPSSNAIFGGDYSSEILDSYILKTAHFSGLVPGEEYVLLALTGIDGDPLANLIHIDQGTASASGKLSFDYVEEEEYAVSYVMACGPSNQNLNDAVISFPRVYASDGEQVIHPTVKYNGKTLTEDRDYTLSGKVSFSTPGEFTCYIRGIYEYSGIVQCTYTVEEKPLPKIRIEGSTGMMAAGTTTLTADFSFAPDAGTEITWSLAEGDEAYATLVPNGNEVTVTAFFATEEHSITVLASAPGKAEPARHQITVYPSAATELTKSIKLYICYYDDKGNEYRTDLSTEDVWYYRLNEWMQSGFGVMLEAIASPNGAGTDFLWTSSDETIATVESYGFVSFTGAAGTVTITAMALDGTGVSQSVTFRTELPGGVEIVGDSDIELVAGKSVTLKVKDNDTGKNVAAKDIVWSLDAGEQPASVFATISKAGKLTAQKVVSRAELKVIGDVYNKGAYVDSVEYSVTVYPAVTHVEIFSDGKPVNGATVSVDTSGTVVMPKLSAQLYPTDAMEGMTWKSSSSKIADVDPSTGALTWNGKNGTVTVTATANDGSRKKATVKVTFATLAKGLTIGIKDKKQIIAAEETQLVSGKSIQLAAELAGNPTNKKVVWSLEHPEDAAYVTLSSSGRVSAKAVYEEKTVTVKATAADGSGKSDTFAVKLQPKDSSILILRRNGKNVTNSTIYADMNTDGKVNLTVHNLTNTDAPKVEWKSSNEKTATVVNGTVTFQKSGTAKITATDINDGRKVTVTVKGVALTREVTVTGAGEVASGKSITLKATCVGGANKVNWSILGDGNQYAKIAKSGKLTANKDITSAKEVVVIATAADGSDVSSKPVTVVIRPIAQGVQIYSEEGGRTLFSVRSSDSFWIRSNTTLEWDSNEAKTLQLASKVYPYYGEDSEASVLNAIQSVTWKSSNKAIASVDEVSGLVTCGKPGTVTITATANDGSGKKVTFKLKVI